MFKLPINSLRLVNCRLLLMLVLMITFEFKIHSFQLIKFFGFEVKNEMKSKKGVFIIFGSNSIFN